MISNLVELRENLVIIAKHISRDRQDVIIERTEALVVKISHSQRSEGDLTEGIVLMKQMLIEVEGQPLIEKEIKDLKFFILKCEAKQAYIKNHARQANQAYHFTGGPGTVFQRYF